MSGKACRIEYGQHAIDFTLYRRDRKTLEITVESDMRTIVVAPLDVSIEAIEGRVRKRASWILKKRRYFDQFVPRTPERRYVAGETHLYLGRQYRLKLIAAPLSSVKMAGGFIVVSSDRPKDPDVTRALVGGWYQQRAQLKFAERTDQCLTRFPDPEVFRPTGLTVRDMQRRWGSMSRSNRLLLNRRLIQAPVDAIDYVITHELCHIAEPHHGPDFFGLLKRVMPDWEKRKGRLERVMA